MTTDDSTAAQTRTLHDTGGAANEYDRIDLSVGGNRTIQQLTYDDAGNMVAADLVGI